MGLFGSLYGRYGVSTTGFTLLLAYFCSQATGEIRSFDSRLDISPVCTTLPCVVTLTCSFNLSQNDFMSIQVFNLGSRRILYAEDVSDSAQFEKHDSVIDHRYHWGTSGGEFSYLELKLAIQACDTYNHRCKVVNKDYYPNANLVEYVPFKEPKIAIKFAENDTDELKYPGSEFSRQLDVVFSELWSRPDVYQLENRRDIKLDEQKDELHGHLNCTWYGSQRHLVTFYKAGVFDLKFVINISGFHYYDVKTVNITAPPVEDDVGPMLATASINWLAIITIPAIIILLLPSIGFFLWCFAPDKCLMIRNKLLRKKVEEDRVDIMSEEFLQNPSFQNKLREIMRQTGVIISLKTDDQEKDDNETNALLEQGSVGDADAEAGGTTAVMDASDIPLIPTPPQRDDGAERDSGMEENESADEGGESELEEDREAEDREGAAEAGDKEAAELQDNVEEEEQEKDRAPEEQEQEQGEEADDIKSDKRSSDGSWELLPRIPESVEIGEDAAAAVSEDEESVQTGYGDEEAAGGIQEAIEPGGASPAPVPKRTPTHEGQLPAKPAGGGAREVADGDSSDEKEDDAQSHISSKTDKEYDILDTEELPSKRQAARHEDRPRDNQPRGWGILRRLWNPRGSRRRVDLEEGSETASGRFTPRRQPTLVLKGPHGNIDRCREMLEAYMLSGPPMS